MAAEPTASAVSEGSIHRTTAALAILSFTAGSMDAIAFLAMGSVFTSAMSGNTILLGLAISQGHLVDASHSLTAIIGYVIGVAAATVPVKRHRYLFWELGLEACFLAAFTALWAATSGPDNAAVTYGLITLSAIAMGVQGAMSRKIGVPGIMTIIFTSTYTAIASSITERLLTGERPLLKTLTRRQLSTLGAYLGSAIFCGIVVKHLSVVAPFIPFAAILVLLAGLLLRQLTLEPA